jgi:transposase, IS30 family
MGTCYNQITTEERTIIAGLLKAGLSIQQIAKELSRAPSTISREISRNFPKDLMSSHLGLSADRKSKRRKQNAHKRPRLKCDAIRSYVEEKILLGWSPEQIAGRLKLELPTLRTNYESIYLYLYREARHLLGYLPKRRKRRHRRSFSLKKARHGLIDTVSIENRDPQISYRNEVGHWEVDTVYSSKGRAALLVLAERKTRYLKISKLQKRTASSTRLAVVRRLRKVDPSIRKSLTFDNGVENAQHKLIDQAINTQSYFCHPYCSYEKGTVENSIGVLRRIFPKSTNFDTVSIAQIVTAEKQLNNRPRKCLNYLTPCEALTRECCT